MNIARILVPAAMAGILPAQSPQLVRDVKTILEAEPSSRPQEPVRVGPWTFFQATTPAAGAELWRTDGTARRSPRGLRAPGLRETLQTPR